MYLCFGWSGWSSFQFSMLISFRYFFLFWPFIFRTSLKFFVYSIYLLAFFDNYLLDTFQRSLIHLLTLFYVFFGIFRTHLLICPINFLKMYWDTFWIFLFISGEYFICVLDDHLLNSLLIHNIYLWPLLYIFFQFCPFIFLIFSKLFILYLSFEYSIYLHNIFHSLMMIIKSI